MSIDAPLYSSDFTDCRLLVGAEEAEYLLHRHILCLRSPFFKAAFLGERFIEGRTAEMRLPEIESQIIEPILRWIYNGSINPLSSSGLGPVSAEGYRGTVAKLLDAAQFLQLPRLVTEFRETVSSQVYGSLALQRSVNANPTTNPTQFLDMLADYRQLGIKVKDDAIACNLITLFADGKTEQLLSWLEGNGETAGAFLPQLTRILIKMRFTGASLLANFPTITTQDSNAVVKWTGCESLWTNQRVLAQQNLHRPGGFYHSPLYDDIDEDCLYT